MCNAIHIGVISYVLFPYCRSDFSSLYRKYCILYAAIKQNDIHTYKSNSKLNPN